MAATELVIPAASKHSNYNQGDYMSSNTIYWTEKELNIIKERWEYDFIHDLVPLFDNKTASNISRKAYMMGLRKKVQSTQFSPITYEYAKAAVQNYTSRQELKTFNTRLYMYINKNEYWLELCSHLAISAVSNFPQTFLYNCIIELFPGKTIRYNDRTVIYPKEIDVYVVEDKIGFEYDGLTFHSSDNDIKSDLNKDKLCKKLGITLYRIKEIKSRQAENILSCLDSFGFNVSSLSLLEIKRRSLEYKFTHEYIINKINEYSNLKEFFKREPELFYHICKLEKRKEYLSNLKSTRVYKMEESDALEKLKLCSKKSEFFTTYKAYYLQMKKKNWLSAISVYNSLYSTK